MISVGPSTKERLGARPSYSVFHENRDPDTDGREGAAEWEATVKEQVQGVVGHVLHLLFENPDYPKAFTSWWRKKRVEGG